MTELPELLAPAGDWDCLRAAIANGADAVYFGLSRFNARLRADNFTEAELPDVVRFCHQRGVKAYVTLNTLVFTGELDGAADYLRLLNRNGVDAVLVQDVGIARLAEKIVPDLAIHASTQMTVTSPEGASFAHELGAQRIVLSRELSLREIHKFGPDVPLEVFVHGALCVAYSGQCLTSESLGQRSANRGECAQACRMPYELIVDGVPRDLGDRRHLLSPQDLAAVDEIPELIRLGVVSFKIEGRLKSPEYVAAVTQVYRKAIDAALAGREWSAGAHDRYQMEMTFSRGFFSGWLHGVDHQRLVTARFGKKRGPLAGHVTRTGRDWAEFEPQVDLKPGDGVVFDTGGDTNEEQGGRIFRADGRRFHFAPGHIDFSRVKTGDHVWKTDDPALDSRLQKTFAGKIAARHRKQLSLRITGRAGEPMAITCDDVRIESSAALQAAHTAPLSTERLREHLGRFGAENRYALASIENQLEGDVILPIAEINRLRRELAFKLDDALKQTRRESPAGWREVFQSAINNQQAAIHLHVLCRTMEQIESALSCGVAGIYCDFEDIRRYKDAVALVRKKSAAAQILLATPRIQKAGEQGFFKLIENAAPDGVLIRNLGAISHFASSPMRKVGDFSLNVANPLSAEHFIRHGLERVTISYDLNIAQALDLLRAAPPQWFEITLHQHMPMFHMEHCVFAAFMSEGRDCTDCGRPCDTHRVHLRDRVGMEHPLRADVGCRNTLFNAVAQTGAQFYSELRSAGLAHFRVELLEENAAETRRVIGAYQSLLDGKTNGAELWRELKAQSQLGVTRGTLREAARA
jgi:U32 family peptidase